MVGAGFSRNAEKVQPDALASPIWDDFVKAMRSRLYLDNKDEHVRSTITTSAKTSDVLRLAQEYETAFGRTDLHGFLRESVRDGEFRPGRVYERLLRLPWRDVFTTNWDTLLERASLSVPERPYNVMRNADEIPLAAQPRIVKLHGSVDAHFPLIFTEEDYRTYPTRFAPLVNTVQQAMMETVFCLIGFSGDDPNFLHWSGWVRDNLGTSTPKIYLIGWLELSIHRRRMLEDRNIIPVDLARHPQADRWPEHVRHEHSTDWVLHTLEYGCPYDVSSWPHPLSRTHTSVPKYLEPVDQTIKTGPKSEPEFTSVVDESSESKAKAVRDLLDVWSYNRRETYPGWLVAPHGVRGKMWSTRERAPLILEVVPNFNPVDSLHDLRELIWRWEIQLEPISSLEKVSSRLEATARDVLNRINCQRRKIDGESVSNVNWSAISEAWITVALALVTAARFRFDKDKFDRILSDLSPFENHEQEIGHRIRHERCLWAIYSLDYKSVKNLLEDWRTEGCDPVWMMRKVALLFEVGQLDEAVALNTAALKAIRTTFSGGRTVGSLSRESWALYCAGTTLSHEEFWHFATERDRRWSELTSRKCNAQLEMHYHAEAIKGVNKPGKGEHFDLGYVWQPTVNFSQNEYLWWVAAHRAVRLTEIAGLPPYIGNIDSLHVIASKNLELAARQLAAYEPELAVRLILRTAGRIPNDAFNFVVSRVRVATLPQEVIERLVQICTDAIEFMLPRIATSDSGRHWVGRLSVVIEALSRFVLRLGPKQVDGIFSQALSLYENNTIATTRGMEEPIGDILSRSWEALPKKQRAKRILDLLNAPVAGMDNFEAGIVGEDGQRQFAKRYPDPWVLLDEDEISEVVRTPSNESQWKNTVNFLVRGLRGRQETRWRAARRIHWLATTRELLTAGEELEVAQALWGEDYASRNGLPTGTYFYDWEFLVLPEPESGLAERRFRAKWLNSNALTETVLPVFEEHLWQVGLAIYHLKAYGKPLSFSDKERSYLTDAIEQWAKKPIPNIDQFTIISRSDVKEKLQSAINSLPYILLEIDLSKEIANILYEKVQGLNDSKMPAYVLCPSLIKILPEYFEDIVQLMRMGLVSDESQAARNASKALEFWLQTSNDDPTGLVLPPTDLVREIGVIIATRRKASLIHALGVARWIFSKGNTEQQDVIGGLTAQGLSYLVQKLRYDQKQDEDIDVPLLRQGCTHLAIAMAQHGFDAEPAVAHWIKNAKDDPLPEIRHLMSD